MRRLIPLLLVLLPVHGCGDGSVGPEPASLELVPVHGDDQLGAPGSEMPVRLEVRARILSTGRGEEGVTVRWDVAGGAGAEVRPALSVTDSAGSATTRLTLGESLGVYTVTASLPDRDAAPVEFRAEAIEAPELLAVPQETVGPGDTITVQGRNVSPQPERNVVTFSGIRGKVVSASPPELRVEVPPCLPEREVSVRLRLGSLVSSTASLHVEGEGEVLDLAWGEDRVLDASSALACVRLPPDGDARYLAVPLSTGLVAGAEYPFSLTGLTVDGQEPSPVPAPSRAGVGGPLPDATAMGRAHRRWELRVRELERRLVEGEGASRRVSEGPGPRPGVDDSPAASARSQTASRAPAPAPSVGDERTFRVLNRDNEFDEVTARVQHVTESCLVYLDEDVPPGGFTPGDIGTLATQFESAIHPTVTRLFGAESDLDGNGRVIILLTPAVNRLTPEGSDGWVGGFFFGLDLLEGRKGSNEGEIFYAAVPDPTGRHGPMLSRSVILQTVPAILAHEFEHMVHFNQRILLAGAETQEALWLSEALAQMAEDLVGDLLRRQGEAVLARDYQMGNWKRARRFLQATGHTSLLASIPPGTLAERGAGWLFLRYLHGHALEEDFLRRITRSTRTGVDNVSAVTGRSWPDLVSSWAGSLFLDGVGIPVRETLMIPEFDIRWTMSVFGGAYPLSPRPISSSASSSFSGTLWSSAGDFFIINGSPPGGLALTLGGPDGQPPSLDAGFRLLLVRLR
jgi:hypothetical protein